MNPDLVRLVEDAKEWSLEKVVKSRCVCVGPCLVHWMIPVATNVSAALEVNVYDGQDDQGKLKITIAQIYTFPCCSLPEPAYFRRGLFVDLTTNASGLCIQYLPLRD